jgi:hypothetical protein
MAGSALDTAARLPLTRRRVIDFGTVTSTSCHIS